MADERSTQANNLADKVMQYTSGGDIQTIDGTAVPRTATGISVADQYILTSSSVIDGPVISNWTQASATLSGFIGFSMTTPDGNGFWTFPHTGVYRIDFRAVFEDNANQSDAIARIVVTDDNQSTTSEVERSQGYINPIDTDRLTLTTTCFMDVTNTSNDKFRLDTLIDGSTTTTIGNPTIGITTLKVTRLGDT